MHRVILVGSPRPDGRSAALAEELFHACIDECPEDGVSIVSVASIEVGPCLGCDSCHKATQAPEALPEDDDNLAIMPWVAQSDALLHRCVIHDDMTEVRKHLDAADELIVVCPVYFASVPSQMKALLDRLQPYYWSNVRRQGKRPMVLHVVGEGGDPHGFEPLIGTVRSALMCVGFQLELVLDWVGKINSEGEIVAEAEEYPIPPMGGFGALDFEMDFEAVEGEPAWDEFDADDDFDDAGWDDDFDYEDDDDDYDGFETVGKMAESSERSKPKLSLGANGAKENGANASERKGSRRPSNKKPNTNKGKASYGKNTPKKGGKRRG